MSARFSEMFLTRLAGARRVTAFTGAGISAESGVPTFRGADGIWSKMKPEELASMEGFLKNPSLVWEWYTHRRKIIADVKPNAGHHALVRMEQFFQDFAVITQNIDNLHRRAGSSVVYELHGNIERNYCMGCGAAFDDADLPARPGVPRCNACGGLIRPDVVWFGEMLPEETWQSSVRAAEASEVFFSIGTSAVVYPAAALPLMAKHAGAFLVEVNPEPTPLTAQTDEFLAGPSGQILPALCTCLEEMRRGVSR